MKCPFCEDNVRQFDGDQLGYLIVSAKQVEEGKNHIHIHGTLDDEILLEQMIDAILRETRMTKTYPKVKSITTVEPVKS